VTWANSVATIKIKQLEIGTIMNLSKISVAALALGAVLIVGINPAQARLTNGGIKLSIENAEGPEQANKNRQRSTRLVLKGLRVQKANPAQAAEYYKKAVEIDETNPWAYIASGDFLYDLGETTTGVECVTAAQTLAEAQGEKNAYQIASQWLEEHDSE
jgi:tetratricopeptide (TPR) repeat protein